MVIRLNFWRENQRPLRGNAPIRFLADKLPSQIFGFSGHSATVTSAKTTFPRRFFCGEILLLIGKIFRSFLPSMGPVVIKNLISAK